MEFKVAPHHSLPALNEYLAHTERFMRGPVTGVGTDGISTVFEVDALAPDKPERNVVITTTMPPAGARIINTAPIFVENQLVYVTAYRPGL